MTIPANVKTGPEASKYCQANHLRILCVDAFLFFSRNLHRLPGNYLEIGVFEGYMLRELALEHPDKMFYGIDPFIEDGYTIGHTKARKRGQALNEQRKSTHNNCDAIPNIKVFDATSSGWNNATTDETLRAMNIGSVLIDGSHHYDDVANDFLLAERALRRGGVIWADDMDLPDVARAIEEFKGRNRTRLVPPMFGESFRLLSHDY